MLSKKMISLLVFLLAFAMIIAGCGIIQKKQPVQPMNDGLESQDDTDEDDMSRETLLYYQDDLGYLVPVMRKIPWEEGIAKAALTKLMDTPEQQQELLGMGLRALLPANAQINGISIKDGLAKVDFNKEAMECDDAIMESNMVQGIVLTLVEFPTIDKVQFMFDGKTVDSLKFGTKVGKSLEAADINPELASDGKDDGGKVAVFFHTTSFSQYEYLVPITRITSSSSITLETAIEELLKGPKDGAGLHMDIPTGTQLMGVQMDDGITYVNFSKEFNALKESDYESSILKAITMTARQFPGIADVKVLVDGDYYAGEDYTATSVFANEY